MCITIFFYAASTVEHEATSNNHKVYNRRDSKTKPSTKKASRRGERCANNIPFQHISNKVKVVREVKLVKVAAFVVSYN